MKINREGIASRVIDGKVFLITVKNRYLHMFNRTGTRIWQLLTQGKKVSEIVTLLVNEYEVTEDTVTQDVTEFIDQLKENGILSDGI